MVKTVLGIIGGSGFYTLPGLEHAHWERVAGPWGEPSDSILFADLNGLPVRFLPRHGRSHAIPPSEINYRANVDAMKRAAVVTLVVAVPWITALTCGDTVAWTELSKRLEKAAKAERSNAIPAAPIS